MTASLAILVEAVELSCLLEPAHRGVLRYETTSVPAFQWLGQMYFRLRPLFIMATNVRHLSRQACRHFVSFANRCSILQTSFSHVHIVRFHIILARTPCSHSTIPPQA